MHTVVVVTSSHCYLHYKRVIVVHSPFGVCYVLNVQSLHCSTCSKFVYAFQQVIIIIVVVVVVVSFGIVLVIYGMRNRFKLSNMEHLTMQSLTGVFVQVTRLSHTSLLP